MFGTVRRQFLVELDARGGARDLAELNRLFAAWVEGVYHRRVHSETEQPPLERFLAGEEPPRLPTPAELREAFLWAERRQVAKTAMVALHSNRYEVDPALVGATVELVFDPFDLTTIEVRYQNRPMGTARPVKVGRHVHPQAKPEVTPTSATARPTGIDYLAMVEAKLAAQTRRTIAYAERSGWANGLRASGKTALRVASPAARWSGWFRWNRRQLHSGLHVSIRAGRTWRISRVMSRRSA